MREFRKLLNSFDRDIDYITAEKEQQYWAMKQVVKIMDQMGEERAIADAKIALESKKREEQEKENMERLLKEQQELKE